MTTTLKIHAAMLLSVAVWCVAAAPSRADLVLANTATASFIDGAGWLAGGSFGTLTLNNSSTSAYQLTSITVELQNNSPTSTANKFGVIFNGGPVVPYNRTTLAGGEARPEIPVPEPSTWAMGFACLMAAAGGRRRAARRTRWVERQPRIRRYGVR